MIENLKNAVLSLLVILILFLCLVAGITSDESGQRNNQTATSEHTFCHPVDVVGTTFIVCD